MWRNPIPPPRDQPHPPKTKTSKGHPKSQAADLTSRHYCEICSFLPSADCQSSVKHTEVPAWRFNERVCSLSTQSNNSVLHLPIGNVSR